jgi:hypothetical protein
MAADGRPPVEQVERLDVGRDPPPRRMPFGHV